MSRQNKMKEISQDFFERVSNELPKTKPKKLFAIGIIGLTGSGKSTLAKMLVEKIPGTVLIRSDGVRFLLKEAGLGWGDNVRVLTFGAARKFLKMGYSVIFDSDFVDKNKRATLQIITKTCQAKLFFIRIKPNEKIALERLQRKWETLERGELTQDFDHFLVITRAKKDAISDRVSLHKDLKTEKIRHLIGEVDNSGTLEELEIQVKKILKKII